MSDHHVLAPLRRWLIDSGAPQRLAVSLLLAVMMIATALVLLNSTGESDRSEIIEIENARPSG
ncbi:hypothetical protein [Jiangella asiatica]|uniref:Uncharacterized protein n=1 Tax=Jiangella asiatica TaxID=2530372 RepID=A0A4R5D8I2_9ACTN|nr:hypothetical protein [Jiangella asiatica]TDE09869.1 hypothetical protein E1269_12900 [Jiangella asiatica]